jgi:predicted RNA-binding protein YlqC (UPF0109 family)
MPKITALSYQVAHPSPDYPRLVDFLVSPFLESPETLSVDCEEFNQKCRVWIRLAFETSDKGRVYGRGGRNLQAIRTVLETAAAAAGQSLHLEVYESQTTPPRRRERGDFPDRTQETRKHRPRTSVSPRFSLKPRF